MKNQKKLYLLIGLSIMLLLAIVLVSCGHIHSFEDGWQSDESYHWHGATCDHTDQVASKAEHTFDEGVLTAEPTETTAGELKQTCSVCGKVKLSVIPPISSPTHTHSYTTSVTAPSCKDRGYTTYTCACGASYKDNFTDTVSHTVGSVITNGDGTHTGKCTVCSLDVTVSCALASDVTAPDCLEQGYTTYTCACGYSVIDDTVAALGHSFSDTFRHNDSYHWRESTCEHIGERDGYEKHNFKSSVTEPTCEAGGYTTYTCDCGYSYVGNYTDAATHTVGVWVTESQELFDESCCEYTVTYSGICSTCKLPITKTESVERHSYYWAVTTVATCTEDGVLTYLCASEECKFHTPNLSSMTTTYSNESAHSWEKTTLDPDATVVGYACACGETKTVVNSVSENVKVTEDEFAATGEIALPEATVGFDSDVKETLAGGGKVTVSCGVLDDGDKEEAINGADLSEEQLKSLEGKKIYNFTLSTENDGDIGQLGGTAKIRIPYTLLSGETPDDIVVWYLSDNGLEAIDNGTYGTDADGNGYVEFTTDHFSYYTVVRLTPALCCERRGHVGSKVADPTCTEGGYTVCRRCSKIIETTPANGHNWKSNVITSPDCSTNGKTLYECSDCDASYESIVAATGHLHTLDGHKEATCTAPGYSAYTCAWCDDYYKIDIPQKQHSYHVSAVNATCTAMGYTDKTCTLCGESVRINYTSATGHKFSTAWQTAEEGHFHVCSVCGAAGDIYDHRSGGAATETAAEICTECEYVITPQIGHTHTLTKVEAVSATCLVGGNVEYYTCSCGKWFADAEGKSLITNHVSVFTNAVGHIPTQMPGKAPDCTAEGYTDYLECTACGILLRGKVTLPATGHSYHREVTAPTCLLGGYTTYTCGCGHSYVGDETQPVSHKYVSTTQAPTCTEDGKTTYVCAICQYSYQGNVIPALGHSYQNKYTFNENEHYRKCARCDDKIDAEAHTPDYEEATEEHGITCTGCGYVITESLEHDHTAEKQVEAKPAGCSTSGNLAYYVCRCGKLFLDAECNTPTDKKSVTVKALGHKLSYVEGKAATCTEDGISSGYHCERCDSDLSGFEVIEALGHTYENGKCVVCGEWDPDYVPETPDVPDVPAEGNVKYYFEMSEGDAKIKFYFYDNYTVEAKMYEDEASDPHVETAMWMMVDQQVAVVYEGSVVQKFTVSADGYTLFRGQLDSEIVVYTYSESYKNGGLTVNVLVLCYKDGSCEIRSATVNEKGEEYDTGIQYGIWTENGNYVVIGTEYSTPIPFIKNGVETLVPVEYVNEDKTCDHIETIHINTVYHGCEIEETLVYLCLLCGTVESGEGEKAEHSFLYDYCEKCGAKKGEQAREVRYFAELLMVEGHNTYCLLFFYEDGTVRGVFYDLNKEQAEIHVDSTWKTGGNGSVESSKEIIVDDMRFYVSFDGYTLYYYGTSGGGGNDQPPVEECPHYDENGDMICDKCGLNLGYVGCKHIDKDENGICDNCGIGIAGCLHIDKDKNGICDKCGLGFGTVEPDYPYFCTHENKHYIEYRPATCFEDGFIRYRCTECGMENSEWQGKLYHDYSGEDKSCIYCGFYSEEDCKHENILESRPEYECDAGRVMKYCSRCGFVFEDYYVDGWHEYDENGNCIYCGTDSQECRHSFVVEKSYGDCTTVYLIVYYCEKCGYYKEDKTYFSEHQIGDDGFCTVCHKSERFDCMHPDLSIKETDATCQNEGWLECRCDRCGMMESVVTAERLPHDYNSQNICNSCGSLNPAFCSHKDMVEDIYGNECNGYHYKSYCPDCYYSFEEYRSGKGHSYNSEGQCTVCGAYDQESCKHDFEILGFNDGDCLLSVNCELYCRKCEYRIWESRTFDSHTFGEDGMCTVCHICTADYCEHKNKETIMHGEPSCMHETYGEIICNDCGRMAKFIQPPSDHDYDEQGYCRFCGEHISWSCPHDNKNVQEEIEGNCCQPGSVIYHCPDCNNVFSESTEYGDHEYDEYGNCRFCGQSEGTVGECLGEAKTERLDIGIYNDFTYIGQYLLRTDYGYVERINVKGRWNYVSDEVIEVMLSVNGEYFSIRLIMKDGMFFEEGGESECKHEYTEIIGMAAPTCEEDGFHTYRCNACGYEFTESIPAQGHSFMDGRCELCGKTEGENDRYVVSDIEFEGARYVLYSDYAAERFVKSEDGKEYCEKGRWKYINASFTEVEVDLGAARTYIIKLSGNECYHENSYVISSKNAGCEENGYRTYKCMGCGYEYTETIAPTGHSYKDGRCEYCYEEYLPSEGERYVVGTYNHNGIQYTFYSDFTADRVIKTADGMANRENGRWLYVTAGDRSEIEVYFNGGAEIIELGKDMCAHKNRKESIRVPSSCVKAGFESFICGDCGESIRIELPISSHIYLNGKCITCGTEEEKVCEHKDVMETGTEAPTCDMPGMVHYRCLDCGEEYTCDIAPLGHDYYNGVCNNCGESEKAEDEEFGRYMTDGLTITFFGNNRFDALRMHMNAVGELVEDHVEGEWWYTYLNGMEYIDLYLDGELWRFVYVAERGMYDRVDIGNNEGEEPKPERYIVNELWYNNVFYTFYSDGSVDRLVKSENGEYLESGSWYYVNEMKTELEAVFGAEIVWIKLHEDECKHESMETVNVQEPGCTTEGYYTYRCNNCGYEYNEVIEPVGHSFDSEGWCFRCGTYESELPRYLVTRIIQDGAEYNFYSDGVVEKIVKSEDGKTYLHMGDWYYADEAKTKIAAIFGDEYLEFYLSECDHNYHCLESSEPACGRDGYYVYECRNCGERYTETIAGTNHVFDDYGRCIYCGAKADWAGGDEDPEKNEITVITGSAEKIYDGRPFMYNNFYVNGLPEGYRVEAVLGASIKDVGVVENYVSQLAVYDYNGNDVTQDFNVTYDYGFLRVVPARFCVISGSATKVYDGIPLVCESFEVVAEDPIPEQFSISADIFGLQTEVGSSPNVVGTVRVFDEYGCDITHCFDITIEYGELIVNAPEDDYPKEEEHPDSPMVCDHDYQCVDSSLPTCGSNGYYLYECVNCGDSYTETIVGTNHVFDDSGRCVYCGAKADLAGGDENNGDGEPSREVVATYKQNGIEYILYSDKKAEKLVKTESGENYSEEGHWYYVSNTEAEAVFYDEVIRIKLSNDEEDTGLMAIYEEESVRIEFYTDYRYEATISSWNEETGDTTFETYQGDWWREYNNGRELTVIEFMGDYVYFVCNENGYAGRVEIENGENPPTDEVQSYGVYKDNGYNITLYSDNTYSGTYEATIDGKYIRESIDGYWEWEMERDIYIVHGYNGERLPLAMTGDGGFYLTGYDLEEDLPDTPMVCGHYGAFVESTLDGNCVSEGYRYYFCPDCGERWVENTGFGKHNIEGDYCLDCGMEFLFLFEYRTTRFIRTEDGRKFEVEAVYVFFNDGSCDLQSYGYLDGKLVDDWREYSFKRNEQGEFVVYDENGNYLLTVVYGDGGNIYHY